MWAFRRHQPLAVTRFPWICLRWVRHEPCITLGMCTMPKAKVSAGVEPSLVIFQRRSWWPCGRRLSTISKCLYSKVLGHMCRWHVDDTVSFWCHNSIWLYVYFQGKPDDSEGAWGSCCSGSNLWQPRQHTLLAGKLSNSCSFSRAGVL